MKKEKKTVKLSLDDLEIESFETKVAPVVTGASHLGTCWQSTCSSATLSCQHSSCAGGGPC